MRVLLLACTARCTASRGPARPSPVVKLSHQSTPDPPARTVRRSHLRKSPSISSAKAVLDAYFAEEAAALESPPPAAPVKHTRKQTGDITPSDTSSGSNGPPPTRVIVQSPATAARTMSLSSTRSGPRPVSPTGPPQRVPSITATLATTGPPAAVVPGSAPTHRATLVMPKAFIRQLRRFRGMATKVGLPPPKEQPVALIAEPASDDESADERSIMELEPDPEEYFRSRGIFLDKDDLNRLLREFAATREALEQAHFIIEELSTRAVDAEARVAEKQEEVGKLAASERTVSQRFSEQASRANALLDEHNRLKADHDRLREQAESLEDKRREATLEAEKQRIRAEGLQAQLDNERSARATDLQSYTVSATITNEERKSLLDKHAADLADCDHRIKELIRERDEALRQRDEATRQRGEAQTVKDDAIRSMTAATNQAQDTVAAAERQHREDQATIASLQQRIQDMSQAGQAMEQQMSSDQETLASMRQRLDEQNSLVANLRAQITTKDTEIDHLQQQVNAAALSQQAATQQDMQVSPGAARQPVFTFGAAHGASFAPAISIPQQGTGATSQPAAAIPAEEQSTQDRTADRRQEREGRSRRRRSRSRPRRHHDATSDEGDDSDRDDRDGQRRRRANRRSRHQPSDDDDSPSSSDSSSESDHSDDSQDSADDDSTSSQDESDQTKPTRRRCRKHRKRNCRRCARRGRTGTLRRAKVPLPPFSPDTVLGWIRTVKDLREKYDEDTLWRAVVKSLDSQFYSFVQGTGKVPTTIDGIIAEIKHRYDFKDAEHAESALRSMTQRASEPSADFVVRATQVARKAIRTKADERRMVRVVIDGCRQPLKAWLLLKDPPPKSFRELETLARSHDLAHGHATGSGGIPVHAAAVPQPADTADTATPAKPSSASRRSRNRPAAKAATSNQSSSHPSSDAMVVAAATPTPPPPTPCRACGGNHWAAQCPLRTRRTAPASAQQPGFRQSQVPAAPGQHQQYQQQQYQQNQQQSQRPFNPDVVCTKCARWGHTAMECWVVQCFNCQQHGHHASKCPFPRAAGAPPPSQPQSAAPQVAQAPARVQQAAPLSTNAANVSSTSYPDEHAASAF